MTLDELRKVYDIPGYVINAVVYDVESDTYNDKPNDISEVRFVGLALKNIENDMKQTESMLRTLRENRQKLLGTYSERIKAKLVVMEDECE